MNNAFITGSHAYGVPHDKSDVDLAILCSDGTAETLAKTKEDVPSVRFGNLNLLVFTSTIKFNLWKKVTEELIQRRPVTRVEACAHFKKHGFNTSDYRSEPELEGKS